MRNVLPAVIAVCALCSAAAFAQFRTLPTDAKRGHVRSIELPQIQIGGTSYRMAPGAIIRDENNRIITPNFLAPGADVVFTFDMHGDIISIFVLSAQERAQFRR